MMNSEAFKRGNSYKFKRIAPMTWMLWWIPDPNHVEVNECAAIDPEDIKDVRKLVAEYYGLKTRNLKIVDRVISDYERSHIPYEGERMTLQVKFKSAADEAVFILLLTA